MPRATRLLALAALSLSLLQGQAGAGVVPSAVTHGTVKVYIGNYRCNLYSYAFTGSFRVGVRTWTGTATAGFCLAGNIPKPPYVELTGDSADGSFYARCTTSLTADPTFSGTTTEPALFSCKAGANGHGLLPLVFEMTTVPNVVTDDPGVDEIGFFDGV